MAARESSDATGAGGDNGVWPEEVRLAELGEESPFAETSPAAPIWLERASDLLAEPDPGPVPFLVEELIVDRAMAAIVGSWKVAKTYAVLELARAIVTGSDAFGRYSIPTPGPVIMVLEESGRAALHRRLDRLARGNAQDAESLGDLYFSANRHVRLNDSRWQETILREAAAIEPRAVFFDPFARVKGAEVDENVQREVGPVLDFIGVLRDEIGAAVGYTAHTGHDGKHQRGSSDLEGYWESRLAIEKNEDGTRTVRADHREAESGHEFRFTLGFDETSRSLRLSAVTSEIERLVEAELRKNPTASKNDVFKATGGRKTDVFRLYDVVKERLYEPRLETS